MPIIFPKNSCSIWMPFLTLEVWEVLTHKHRWPVMSLVQVLQKMPSPVILSGTMEGSYTLPWPAFKKPNCWCFESDLNFSTASAKNAFETFNGLKPSKNPNGSQDWGRIIYSNRHHTSFSPCSMAYSIWTWRRSILNPGPHVPLPRHHKGFRDSRGLDHREYPATNANNLLQAHELSRANEMF